MDIFIESAFAQLQGPPRPIGSVYDFNYSTLGAFVNNLTPIAFSVAGIMVAFYFLIGTFELITSQGDKAHIVSARAKIYHAIIGLILLLVLFFVVQYLFDILGLNNFGII